MEKKFLYIISFILFLPLFARYIIKIISCMSYIIPDIMYILFPLFTIVAIVLAVISIFIKTPKIQTLFTYSFLFFTAGLIYTKIYNSFSYSGLLPLSILDLLLYEAMLGYIIILIICLYLKGGFKYNLIIFLLILLYMLIDFIKIAG